MTGTLPPAQRPAAITAYYPVIGFWSALPATPDLNVELDESGRVPSSLLFPPGTPTDELDGASPIDLLHPGFPPTVIQHGSADQLIDVRSSITLYQSLRTHGVQTSLHLHTDRDHEFDRAPSQLDATADVVGRFIEHTVLNRETAVEEIRRYAFSIR